MPGEKCPGSTPDNGYRLDHLTEREARALEAAIAETGSNDLATAVRRDYRGRDRLSGNEFVAILGCLRANDREELIRPAFESNILWIERAYDTELEPELRGLFEYLY